jgi:murein DD-endopeptidase MepM/ murein hydrolase activator NlpD
MADLAGKIDAITRSIAGLDSKVNGVLPKLQTLLSGNFGGAARALGSSSTGLMAAGSIASSVGSGVSNIMSGSLGLVSAGVSAATMAMPNVNATVGRATAFYTAAISTPGLSYNSISQATFNAMRGGISSYGSDALAATSLTSMGIMASTGAGSTYMQDIRATANAAKYLGMDNQTAAQAIGGFGTGAMSTNLMTAGIFTSNLQTGKTRSITDIFSSMKNALEAGQGKITAADVNNSFYKGTLGATLNNWGLSDAQKELFRQYLVADAQGKKMDLTSNAAMKKLMGNGTTPQSATLDINTTATGQMQDAQNVYIQGMQDAAKWFKALNPLVEDLVTQFGRLNSSIQTFTGTPSGNAIATNAPKAIKAGANILGGTAEIGGTIIGAILGSMVEPGGGTLIGGALGGEAGKLLASLLGAKGGVKGGNALAGTTDLGNKSSMRATHTPANGPVTATLHEHGPMWGPAGHNGTDFGVGDGSPVYAAADGKVSTDSVGSGARSYGHYITLDHGNGYKTLYAHLDPSSALVHPGDTVTAGQVIGKSGHSGHVTGPHLHFEVQKDGVSVPIAGFLGGNVDINPPAGNGASTSASSTKSSKKTKSLATGILSSAIDLTGVNVGISGVSASSMSLATALGADTSAVGSLPSWNSTSALAATSSSSSINTSTATGVGGSYKGISMGSVSPVVTTGSIGGSSKVDITIQIAQASRDEARQFAEYVKHFLENEHLTNRMGSL